MRNPSRALALLCTLSFLLLPLTTLADERQSKSVAQLLEDLRKLEAVASDPATQPEVRELNRGFLSEMRARLRQVALVRIEALRKYRASVGDSLSPEEGRAIENSVGELVYLLEGLGEGGATPAAAQSASPTAPPPAVYYAAAPALPAQAVPVALKAEGGTGGALYGGHLFSREAGGTPPPAPIPAQSSSTRNPERTRGNDFTLDAAREEFKGEKVRGPARIRLENLNILRYDIRVGQDVSFTPGPDLKLPFIPPIPGQAAKTNPGGGGGAGLLASVTGCTNIPVCFSDSIDTLNRIERDKVDKVNKKIVDVTGTVNGAKADLESLVSASDSILASGGGPQTIISIIGRLIGNAAGNTGIIDTALSASWPDAEIETLIGELNVLRNELVALPTLDPQVWATWYAGGNKTAYDSARARIDELRTQLDGLKSTASTQGAAFREAQNKLRLWRPILASVRDGGPAGFTRTVDVGCGSAFNMNRETKVSIVKRDRLADPGTAATSQEVVTVVCSSPFSVSAGFGFSFVDEREFAFVQSTKTTTGANGQTTETVINRFGLKNSSSFKTLPTLLLNTRLWEPNETFALHASAGAVVDIKTGEGGAELEYIVGPSISFRRSFFITPGLHIGRVPKLAGGFQLGQEVPTGVSTPPVEKAWKPGFVTTFTYKIK
ncbi:MAG: hypothetical protein LC802_07830 [Acidobacteria bacterium]|nr:hypothetical protein [Acidobacteriota bacterium]